MQISTVYKQQQIVGTVLQHSTFFLEVEITSPYTNQSLSCTVPYFGRSHAKYEGCTFSQKCDELLTNLYEFGHAKERHFSQLASQFNASDVPDLVGQLNALKANYKPLKYLLRAQFLRQSITQKDYQQELEAAREFIKQTSEKLSSTIQLFFKGTPFEHCDSALRSALVDDLVRMNQTLAG